MKRKQKKGGKGKVIGTIAGAIVVLGIAGSAGSGDKKEVTGTAQVVQTETQTETEKQTEPPTEKHTERQTEPPTSPPTEKQTEPPTEAKRSTKAYWTTSDVNVRQSPSTDSEVLTQYENGHIVPVYEISEGWAEILYNDASAYISADYLTDTEPASSVKVWITDSGTKYHRKGCYHINGGSEVTLEYAISAGKEPCKDCNPPT